MTTRVLVTGATGLVGSNICEQLVAGGYDVTALARPGSEVSTLVAMGVTITWGDLGDVGSVARAFKGLDECIHSAAVDPAGGAAPRSIYDEVNTVGTRHILDAAGSDRRVIVLNTSGAFDRTTTVHEGSPLASGDLDDPYAHSKREVHREVIQRVAEGADLVTVLPAATIGPAPSGARATTPPGFNSRMILAIRGEVAEFPQMPLSVVLASDVARACVAALEVGVAGAVYLPWGRTDEIIGACDLLNLACESAGVGARVRDITGDDLQDPEVRDRWGPSIVRSATVFPDPYFTNEVTAATLGYEAVPLKEAVRLTVDWMRSLAII